MRVTNIDFIASNSSLINLSFRDPRNQNPYLVRSIEGLDADDITPKFYGVSSLSNDRYYNLSLEKRDIILKVELNPQFSLGKSYSDLRDELYKVISSSRTGAVQLQFKDGLVAVAAISGFVTKFEADLFTQSPNVQLTINCSEPMLKAVTEVNVDITGLSPTLTTVVDNESTAPHGVRFGFIFSNSIVDFSIKDAADPTWQFLVDLTGSALTQFQAGDELHFSSENNNRYLYLIRGLDVVHLIDKIVPGSIWPVMFPGNNDFVCSDFVSWDYIAYYPTYWGV